MAAVTAYPTDAQFTGVAKETTPGTVVPMTATLLTDTFTWKDTPVWLDDKAYRGVMGNDSFNVIQGVYYSDISCGGPVFADTIGYVLGNLLGDITTTGSSAPYTHVISLLNPTSGAPTGQPTTHTLEQYYGPTVTSGARTFPSACFSQVVFEFTAATGLLTWTGKANSWVSQAAAARPTAAPSAAIPQAAWVGLMGLGGTASGAPIVSLKTAKVTVTRELENEYTVNGTQNPLVIFRGGLSVTFDATFVAQNEVVYTDMITNAQPQIQFKFASGAGAAAINFQVDLQKAAFTSAAPDFSQKSVSWSVSGKGVFNSTNVGTSGGLAPVQFTLQNAVTSGTYI